MATRATARAALLGQEVDDEIQRDDEEGEGVGGGKNVPKGENLQELTGCQLFIKIMSDLSIPIRSCHVGEDAGNQIFPFGFA